MINSNIRQKSKYYNFKQINKKGVIKMGNIERRIYSPNANVDNPSTRSQQQNNSQSTEPIANFNPDKESLLQLTISDGLQLNQIMTNISLYSVDHGISPSISQLKEYYKIKKDGYCTTQHVFYLVFNGCGCCGLKDQFGVRKMMNTKFQDPQILAVLKTYLVAVLVYVKQFKRKIDKIDLDDIGFQPFILANQSLTPINQPHSYHHYPHIQTQTNAPTQNQAVRMYFIDPWLKQRRQQQIMSVNQVNVLLQNPSPQRLEQSYNVYNHFNNKSPNGQPDPNGQRNGFKGGYRQNEGYSKKLYSLLFSIGVIGLKMLEMGFVDDIYVKLPQKKVNFQRIEQYIEKHTTNSSNRVHNLNPMSNLPNLNGNTSTQNHHEKYTTTTTSIMRQKLISGLKILLLSNTPKERQKIYDFWDIKLNQTNILTNILLENDSHLQSQPQLSTQSSEIHPNNVPATQRQNNHGYRNNFQDKNNLPKGYLNYTGINNNSNRKKDQSINRNQLYSPDDPQLTSIINPNLPTYHNNHSNNNDLNTHSRQYVYKFDQLKHYPESNNNNNQNLINYHTLTPQTPVHIQKPIHTPLTLNQLQNHHQQRTHLTQVNCTLGHKNFYQSPNQTNVIHNQFSSRAMNSNHHVSSQQVSQNGYLSRLEYKIIK